MSNNSNTGNPASSAKGGQSNAQDTVTVASIMKQVQVPQPAPDQAPPYVPPHRREQRAHVSVPAAQEGSMHMVCADYSGRTQWHNLWHPRVYMLGPTPGLTYAPIHHSGFAHSVPADAPVVEEDATSYVLPPPPNLPAPNPQLLSFPCVQPGCNGNLQLAASFEDHMLHAHGIRL